MSDHRRLARVLPAALILALVTACGGDPDTASPEGACAPFAPYQGHEGTTVTIFSPVRDVESDNLARAWEQFESCTGIDIAYEGSDTFEVELPRRVAAGSPPDLAFLPQPGLIEQMARAGSIKPAPPPVKANAERWWSPDWLRYGTVDGTLYAVPADANVKSLVWYSPRMFRDKGYTVPHTWQEMLDLSDRIAADGVKPWCAGIASGVATGWPATDWVEDALLRSAGPKVYDDWVAHRIAFNDPRVLNALDRVGSILRNPAYVNGGYGGVDSIATIGFQEGGLPILEGKCAMHRQASFYANWWPPTATISEDGDIYAFYLPTMNSGQPGAAKPVLGAGTFLGAFTDKPEVTAVATYFSTPDFANARARTTHAISANKGLDPTNLSQPVARLAAELLAAPDIVFRFDGSDLMPAEVGTGSFWRGMTEWIAGKPSASVLGDIERSWPS
jgi:alpha-glucoside transport system substrate-binding protein